MFQGYGHSTPATKLGKMFTVAYSTIGIPLALIMFQVRILKNIFLSKIESFRALVSEWTSSAVLSSRSWGPGSGVVRKKRQSWIWYSPVYSSLSFQYQVDLCLHNWTFKLTFHISNFIVVGGTILYSTQEGWTYFESCYYCFITLTTIGFGDFVALQKHRSLTLRPGYVVASFCFLLWGLSAVASSINLLVLKFMTISLEEEEQGEDELHGMQTNIVTLDEEVNMKVVLKRREQEKRWGCVLKRNPFSMCHVSL